MFSDKGRSLDQDTVEYAWLLEIQLGKLSGKLSSPQLYSVVACLETLVLLLSDSENELNSPKDDSALTQPPAIQSTMSPLQNVQIALQHLLQSKNSNSNTSNKGNVGGGNQAKSAQAGKKDEKPKQSDAGIHKDKNVKNKETEVDLNEHSHKLKYKFCRVAIDAIDFWLVEAGAALQLWVKYI